MFDDLESDTLHAALASVFIHALDVGDHRDARKKREFGRLLTQQLGISDQQVEHFIGRHAAAVVNCATTCTRLIDI